MGEVFMFEKTIDLAIDSINEVLLNLARLLMTHKDELIAINKTEITAYAGNDTSILNRLKITDAKLAGMVNSLQIVASLDNPVGKTLFKHTKGNGLEIENRTVPFGTVLIIYESRPDVTIEAAAIAFKSGNKIILKGGKESHKSNRFLESLWHKALQQNNMDTGFVQYLELDREQTQNFLQNAQNKIDLVVPRGGDGLIQFVKQHASIPVLVSGRGNNFIYIDDEVDNNIIEPIIMNAKLSNISACNALDKVIINTKWKEENSNAYNQLIDILQQNNVEVIILENITDDAILYEEFLDKKIVFLFSDTLNEAIEIINTYSGKHSASILSTNENNIATFQQNVDCAAVYSNASTRFTDGSEFGLGAELAISTDKLHHRGPLGLQHLVTNKWFIKGNGQIRN